MNQHACRGDCPTFRIVVGAFALLVVTGCGGTKLYPVDGKVTFKNGTAYTGGGQVVFDSVGMETKVSARGILQPDGSFRMGTYQDADGVPVGRYRVAVVPPPPRNLERPPADWPPFDKRFSNQGTSKLECTVTPGHNACNLTVEK